MGRTPLVLQVSETALRHPHWVLVERVAASRYFQSSAKLRDFLFYVSDCALRNAPEEATEQHVGIRVFQRPPGYNCAEDNIVRTHARSLRQKLAEYFQNEGSQEKTIIEIPKGHYLPVFHSAIPAVPMLPAIDATKIESSNSKLKWLVIALLLGVCFAVAGWWWHVDRAERDSAIDRFWAPFFANNSSLVIYSNPLFVGNATDGLRYAPPSDDSTANLTGNYSYTGVGEVVSVYDLSRLFASFRVANQGTMLMYVDCDQPGLNRYSATDRRFNHGFKGVDSPIGMGRQAQQLLYIFRSAGKIHRCLRPHCRQPAKKQ